MRKVPIILFFFSIAWLFSCTNKSSNPLKGKWASFSYDFGYSELSINDSTIQIFTHWIGNQGEWHYEVVKDSIKIQHGYKGFITEINDSILIITGKNLSDTFYRLDASTMTFNRNLMFADEKNDTLFNEFYREFLERAEAFILNHNISLEKFDRDQSKIIEEKIIHPVDVE
jgi:hypothetical protein